MAQWHRSWLALAVVPAVLATSVGCKSQKAADDLTIPDSPRTSDRGDSGPRPAANVSTWKDAGEATPSAAPNYTFNLANTGNAAGTGVSAGSRSHTIKKGDTMYSIARAYYNGDVHKWHAIYDANRDRITDPNHLKVGQVIAIPD